MCRSPRPRALRDSGKCGLQGEGLPRASTSLGHPSDCIVLRALVRHSKQRSSTRWPSASSPSWTAARHTLRPCTAFPTARWRVSSSYVIPRIHIVHILCGALTRLPPWAGTGLHAPRDQRNFSGAVEDASAALELDPTNAKAFYRRGLAYQAMGRADRAIECALRRAGWWWCGP